MAYCGLDCETCDARLATIRDDDELRKKTADLWTELNGVEITPAMINCLGCRVDGPKTPFCESLCHAFAAETLSKPAAYMNPEPSILSSFE